MSGPTPPLAVRPARVEDLPGMAFVHVETWRSTYRGMVPDARLESMSVEGDLRMGFGQWVAKPPEGHGSFVAEDPKRGVVGFAVGHPNRGTDLEFTGELGAIYVLKEFQGLGLGRKLVGAVARHLLNTDRTSMIVWVLEENPARRFYERLGGTFHRQELRKAAGTMISEVAYGWRDIRGLVEPS